MTMTRKLFAALLALLIAAPAFAQAQRMYSQPELDQMLAPIALYPDPLLSQVLMAATYPEEVSEAARWSRANPGLQGDDAVRAAQNEDWDPSVQSLVAFPQILARMDEDPGWTRSLGDAFLTQEPHVMDSVQQLRRRAQATGNLQSSEQMYVQQQGRAILIQPASPQYVYVPYYDPLVVYGPWWWPAYRPVAWAPWAGYARHHRPGVSAGFWWGSPVGLSLNFFFGNFDWHQHQVRVVRPSAYYYRPPFAVNRAVAATPFRWQHESSRRAAFAERRAVQASQPVQVQSATRRQAARAQAQPAAIAPAQTTARVQAQPQAQLPAQQRVERREERRAQRQAAPAAVSVPAQPQPTVQPRSERRDERHAARVQAQRAPVVQAQPQVRQEQRARMPEAVAPQLPRAERHERRELRQEQRQERGQKG